MTTVEAAFLAPPAGVARSDETTVEVAFRTLGPAVLGYLRASGAHDSEDVLGEVFVRVARGMGRFQGDEADLKRWVFTIAYRCLVDEHRRRARERRLFRQARASTVPPPNEPLDARLVDALRKLTAEQREVVTLRFVADLPLDEVARITGRPTGAVKSLQHRALRQLEARLGATGLDPG